MDGWTDVKELLLLERRSLVNWERRSNEIERAREGKKHGRRI